MVMSYALVYVMLFMLYMGVIGFGNMVAMEITSEKSSRVMELLITSVSPLKQMFGKIIGICLLALSQIALLIAVGCNQFKLIRAAANSFRSCILTWHDLQISLIVYFLIFYFLGFFIYATVFAAVGSLVSRTEDVGQAIMPVTLLIVAAFMIAMFGLNNPNAGLRCHDVRSCRSSLRSSCSCASGMSSPPSGKSGSPSPFNWHPSARWLGLRLKSIAQAC